MTHLKQQNKFHIVLSSPLDDTANIHPLLEELDVKSRLNDQVCALYCVWMLCNAQFLQ